MHDVGFLPIFPPTNVQLFGDLIEENKPVYFLVTDYTMIVFDMKKMFRGDIYLVRSIYLPPAFY